jgi:hypothetical protein
VSKVDWAHPEFGSVIASCSFDRTAKVWEQASANALLDTQQFPNMAADGGGVSAQPVSRWLERNVMAESKGTVRDVAFAPHYFGLKLVCMFCVWRGERVLFFSCVADDFFFGGYDLFGQYSTRLRMCGSVLPYNVATPSGH